MENNNKLFSDECINAMNEAYQYAQKKKFEFVTVDNFMLFVAKTQMGRSIFEAMQLNVNEFYEHIEEYLNENIPKSSDNGDKPQWTIQLKALRDQSVLLQQAGGQKSKVDEGHIIVALFHLNEEECFTLNYFDHFGITRFDIMSFIAHGKRKNDNQNKSVSSAKDNAKVSLNKFAINLNQKAKDGKIDPVIGREKEIDKAIEILCQRRKNNPLLVGEPGVGKTAIAEGLARKIVLGEVPSIISQFQIYSLDMPSVLAGTKYRGDFEERLKNIIKEASADPNIVLVIDEIHTLIGTGSGTGTMDASNILKPALSSGEIKVIGATTYEEYRKYFEKEGALSRRFQKLDVVEPTVAESIEILKGIKSQFESFHGISYTDSAIEAAVQLTTKYINDRCLPDKAIDVIDMAGSQAKIKKDTKEIDEHYISGVVAAVARIPVDSVKETEKFKLKNLDLTLKKEIFGQNDAIDKVVDNIIYTRSNILNREKPIGSFLFAGPSGVGKTELAKQLSKQLGVQFIRFDMSEYMEKHTVSRLVGSPPGYVGHEQGGQLTNTIRKHPYCVLLLDEIEKAHPDIFNILLQIMDYATLTDNEGKKANFQNVIVIMTTNIGAAEMNKASIGFSKEDTSHIDREAQVKKSFSPEFYNRLDSVIQFNALNESMITDVVIKHVKKLQEALLENKVISIFTNEAISLIAKDGFDPKLGARPIQRFIEKNVAQKISKEVMFGKLENGGEIKVDVLDGKLDIQYLHSYENKLIEKKVSSDDTITQDLFTDVDVQKEKVAKSTKPTITRKRKKKDE